MALSVYWPGWLCASKFAANPCPRRLPAGVCGGRGCIFVSRSIVPASHNHSPYSFLSPTPQTACWDTRRTWLPFRF